MCIMIEGKSVCFNYSGLQYYYMNNNLEVGLFVATDDRPVKLDLKRHFGANNLKVKPDRKTEHCTIVFYTLDKILSFLRTYIPDDLYYNVERHIIESTV